jgi:hypothetical protein
MALTKDQTRIIEALAKIGGKVHNPVVQASLGWDKDTYFSARAPLIDLGFVVAGAGPGGFSTLTEEGLAMVDVKSNGGIVKIEPPQAAKQKIKIEPPQAAQKVVKISLKRLLL